MQLLSHSRHQIGVPGQGRLAGLVELGAHMILRCPLKKNTKLTWSQKQFKSILKLLLPCIELHNCVIKLPLYSSQQFINEYIVLPLKHWFLQAT